MATSLSSSLHHRIVRRHHHSLPPAESHASSCPFFLKPSSPAPFSLPRAFFSLSASTISTAATSATSSPATSPDQSRSLAVLESHLSSRNFQLADEETRRLLVVLAGEAAQKRKYVFFSEIQFIPASELSAIDDLWRKYSDGKFGYSVQRKIWKKVRGDFSTFFIKVDWMKKLETEVEQYTYRWFPGEFLWELNDQTPAGHLPLTNALRGTQLLNSILNHPAFESNEQEEEVEEVSPVEALKAKAPTRRSLTADYTF